LDIGVLGYISIVQHKEHSPEVLSIPPGTPCIYIYICMCVCVCMCVQIRLSSECLRIMWSPCGLKLASPDLDVSVCYKHLKKLTPTLSKMA